MSKEINHVNTYAPGMGFAGLLAVVLIALKLTHVISWSWGWIFASTWIGWCLFLGGLLIYMAVHALIEAHRVNF